MNRIKMQKIAILLVSVVFFSSGYCSPLSTSQDLLLMFKHYKADYFTASKFCNYFGRQLVSLETAERYLAMKMFLLNGKFGIEEGDFWTSATTVGSGIGNYYWLATGKRLTFADWGDQPDSKQGTDESSCVAVNKKGDMFAWRRTSCQNSNFVICEEIRV